MNFIFPIKRVTNAIFWIGLVGFSGWLSSCASTKRVAPSSAPASSAPAVKSNTSFSDDLSLARPQFAMPPAPKPTPPPAKPAPETRRPIPMAEPLHINRRLDALLDTIALRNRTIRYAQGYRIQIYVGDERTEVDNAKRLTYQNFPELNPYLTYRQPTYRLKVGDFMRRLDAERYLAQIRQQFSSAILLPDKVDIRRSLAIK